MRNGHCVWWLQSVQIIKNSKIMLHNISIQNKGNLKMKSQKLDEIDSSCISHYYCFFIMKKAVMFEIFSVWKSFQVCGFMFQTKVEIHKYVSFRKLTVDSFVRIILKIFFFLFFSEKNTYHIYSNLNHTQNLNIFLYKN